MSGCRILLIDDDPQTASFVEETMADHACSVAYFQSVYEAIDELTLTGADLVLLSADIPDGLAACTRIKADPDLRDIPVAVMSMDIERPDLQEHRAEPHHRADLYLERPFDAGALETHLRGLLEGGAPEAEEEPGEEPELVDIDAIEFTDGELDSLSSPAPPTEAMVADIDAGILDSTTDPEVLHQTVSASGFETAQDQALRAQAERDDAAQEVERLRREREETSATATELQRRVTTLETRAQQAEEKLTETVIALAKAQQERDDAQLKLTRASRERDAVIRELARLREQSEERDESDGAEEREALAEAQDELETLRSALNEAREERDQSDEALNEARRERDEALARRDELQQQLSALEAELATAKSASEHAEGELGRAREERDESAHKLSQVQRERDAVIEELVRSRRKREELNTTLTELQETSAAREAEHETLSAELAELRERSEADAGASERLAEIETELTQLREEHEARGTRLAAAENERDELAEKLAAAEKERDEALAEVEPLRGQVSRERGRAKALLGALSDRQDIEGAEGAAEELTRLAEELAEVRGQLAEVDDVRDRARKEQAELREERDRLAGELRDVRRALEDMQTGEAQLRSELEEALRAEIEEQVAAEAAPEPTPIALGAPPPAESDAESDGEGDEARRAEQESLEALRASLAASDERVEELERRLAVAERERDALHPRGAGDDEEIEVDFGSPSQMEVTSELRAWIDRARIGARRTHEALAKAKAGLDAQQKNMAGEIEAWRKMEADLGVSVQALLRGGASSSPTQFNEPLEQLQRLLQQGGSILQRRCAVDDSINRLLEQVTAAWRQTEEQGEKVLPD